MKCIYSQTCIIFKGSYFIFRLFTLWLFISSLSHLIVILFILFYAIIQEISNLTLSRERLLLFAVRPQWRWNSIRRIVLFCDSTNYFAKLRHDQWLWYVSLYYSVFWTLKHFFQPVQWKLYFHRLGNKRLLSRANYLFNPLVKQIAILSENAYTFSIHDRGWRNQ